MDTMTQSNIEIIEANLNDKVQAENFLRLISEYMADPMGESLAWTEEQRSRVISSLKTQPGLTIFLAKDASNFIGVVTCFQTFSTFLAKNMLNIHDIFVEQAYRGKGIGKQLIQKVDEKAKENDCGKITLEVRKDNLSARGLYRSQGYSEAPHSMFFWTKYL